MEKVNLTEKFRLFEELWTPKIVGELNGQYVKLAKTKGEFVWHKHDTEDELFLVVSGTLTIKLRDKDIRLEHGEFLIVPKGVEHKPISENEAHVLVFEPKSTKHTGDVESEITVKKFDRI
jgi:mannose-6-phosphate isomerase-like protein (cupin superfamily)